MSPRPRGELRLGRTSEVDPRRREEEPDLARDRGRPALPARRPRHRDDRSLQRPDRAVRDRARRGAPEPLAPPRRTADQHGAQADAGEGDRHLRLRAVKELLEYLAKGLVDSPDAVAVESFEEDDGTVVLELHVADDDVGKVIGRSGRTVNALRTVVRASSVKHGRRVLIDVVD